MFLKKYNRHIEKFLVFSFFMFFSTVFSNSAYAFGSITSGVFDTPPSDDELAENFAVYRVGDKYVVDESPKMGGVSEVICSRGSKVLHNKKSDNGFPENYLVFENPTDKYISFTSDNESIANADKTAFYCNNVGRTLIHVDSGVYSPAKYQFKVDYEVVVYDLQVNNEDIREQVTSTIDKAMLAWAGGTGFPENIDEKAAEMLYDIIVVGDKLNVNLGVDIITDHNISEEYREKIKQKIKKEEEIAAYYDINMETLEDNIEGIGHIKELDGDIDVTIDIPKLAEIKNGHNRSFFVIRVHNGVAERIEARVLGNKIKFKTDRFSIYALGYTDTPQIKSPDAGTIANEKQNLSTNYSVVTIGGILLTFILLVGSKALFRKAE